MTAQYLFALAVMLGVMGGSFALVRLAKKRGLPLASMHPIGLVAQRSVGPAARLLLVEVEGQKLLVGVTRGGMSLIHAIADKPVAEAKVLPFDTSFSAVLKRAGAR